MVKGDIQSMTKKLQHLQLLAQVAKKINLLAKTRQHDYICADTTRRLATQSTNKQEINELIDQYEKLQHNINRR